MSSNTRASEHMASSAVLTAPSHGSNPTPPEQSILWRRIDSPGHDWCGLWRDDSGWCLRGTALFLLEAHPCQLDYEVQCDVAWHTRSAVVAGWIGRKQLKLQIVAQLDGRWELNGGDQPAVSGCTDIDLSFTPATNLIAIRRLALAIGHQADAAAAWVRFPELYLERLKQRYHRVATTEYDYSAPDVDYSGKLQVSSTGFVTHYPGLWELEALL